MIKALLLIINPTTTWDRISQARNSLGFVLFAYLLPMLVLVSAAEGYGLVALGKWQGQVAQLRRFSVNEAVLIQSAQLVMWLLVVFAGALLVKSLGETFHGRHTLRQSFTVVAYGLGPMFLLRLLDVAPVVSPWLTWGIGICLTAGVLYEGVPKVMDPDPPHAFGLYLVSCVLLIMITGLVRFITAWYFQGRFIPLHKAISGLAEQLPF